MSIFQDEKHWLKTLADCIQELDHTVPPQHNAPPWVLRLLFSLSEKERRRLASDLHDTALQDQLLLYRKLTAIASDPRIAPDLRTELQHVTVGLLDVIHQIRETCNELRPPFLREKGIVDVLDELFAHTQLRSDFTIDFDATHFNLQLDAERALVLYRIVQELLTNTGKHAKATQVHLHLSYTYDMICLHYRDNGVGMDLTRSYSTFAHMGLSGIKERVASLEGDVFFTSTPGAGFAASIRLPFSTSVYPQEAEEVRQA